MSNIAGELLWRRIRFGTGGSFPAIPSGGPGTDIDTGITQVTRSFPPGEPPMGIPGTASPADGTLPASRIQVIPLAPIPPWQVITHDEPYFNTITGTVHVRFHSTEDGPSSFSVLIWDPHSVISPGQADTYKHQT